MNILTPIRLLALDGRWADEIQKLIDALRADHQPVEESFLILGDRLCEAVVTTGDLNAMAAVLAGRMAEPGFQDTLRGLDNALLLIDRLQDAKDERESDLACIGQTSLDILLCLGELAKSISYVHILGVNARIEVSQVGNDANALNVFSHQITNLAQRAGDTVAQARHDLTRLAAAAEQASDAQAAFSKQNHDALGQIRLRLNASIAALHRREHKAGEVLGRLPQVLEESQQRIGKIVADIQIGDIARQRAEHVEAGLNTLRDLLSGEQPLPESDDPDRQLGVCVSTVSDLLRRQLTSLSDDVSAKATEIRRDFNVISERITTIDEQISGVYAADVENGESFLAQIDHDVQAVAQVVESFCQAILSAETATVEVNAAALGMIQSMQAITEIDADMNLLGLNASIKCANLGGVGRALNVVAQELQKSARRTGHFSRTVSSSLHQLLDAARRLSDTAAELPDELTALKQSLSNSVGGLRSANDETAEVLAQIRERSSCAITSVKQALPFFNADQRYRAIASDATKILENVAREAQPDSTSDKERDAALRFLESHYTMDRERNIHRTFVGAASTDPGATDPEDDLSDILF
jgi:methyl-accepting chemotaxis protein